MPNWCENRLEVSGPKTDRDAFVKNVSRENTALSLDALCPMPKELAIEDGSAGEFVYDLLYGDKERILAYPWVKELGIETPDKLLEYLEKKHPDARVLAEQYRHNIETHGNQSWYEWCVAHWGTKWDVDVEDGQETAEANIYHFLSAWSPPIEALEEGSKRWPSLTFKLCFREPGMDFRGMVCIENGRYENEYSGTIDDKMTCSCDVCTNKD